MKPSAIPVTITNEEDGTVTVKTMMPGQGPEEGGHPGPTTYAYQPINTPLYRGLYFYNTASSCPMLMFFDLNTFLMYDITHVKNLFGNIACVGGDVTDFFALTFNQKQSKGDKEVVRYYPTGEQAVIDELTPHLSSSYVNAFVVTDEFLVIVVKYFGVHINNTVIKVRISDNTVAGKFVVNASTVNEIVLSKIGDTHVLVYELSAYKHRNTFQVISLVDGSILYTLTPEINCDYISLHAFQSDTTRFGLSARKFGLSGIEVELFTCSIDKDTGSLLFEKDSTSQYNYSSVVAFEPGFKIRSGTWCVHVLENYNSFSDTKPAFSS